MNRELWEHTTHSLRKLLHKFDEEDFGQRAVEFRFGLQYNPMFDFYHLWDQGETKTIATIRRGDDKTTLRFSPESIFRHEMVKCTIDDLKTILVPSTTLTRHDSWVLPQIDHRCRRAVERYFLEQRGLEEDGEPHLTRWYLTYNIPIQVSGLTNNLRSLATGLISQTETAATRIRVYFESNSDMERHGSEAQEMLRRMLRTGAPTPTMLRMRFPQLVETFRRFQQQDMQNQILERHIQAQRYDRGMPTYRQEYLTNAFGDVSANTTVSAGGTISYQDYEQVMGRAFGDAINGINERIGG